MVGQGTETSPYLISNKEDFLEFISLSNTKDLYFRQVADIDLSDVDFDSMNVFEGIYDGGYHKLIGLKKTLFKSLKGIVKHLRVINPNIENNDNIVNFGVIANLSIGGQFYRVGIYDGNIKIPKAIFAGTLVGLAKSNTSIKECFAKNTFIEALTYVGGLIGTVEVPYILENNYFTGTVKTTHSTPVCGGFVGSIKGAGTSSNSVFSNCYSHVKLITIFNDDTNNLIGKVEL